MPETPAERIARTAAAADAAEAAYLAGGGPPSLTNPLWVAWWHAYYGVSGYHAAKQACPSCPPPSDPPNPPPPADEA